MNGPAFDERVAELFDAHSRALGLYARQWAGAGEADDVVQRVFVRLVTGARLPANARTWLYRCVRNEAIGAWRSARRRGRRERAVAADAGAWFAPSPGAALDAEAAQRALASLPAEQREVVTLRLWSGLTLAEIGEVTGAAVSTVHERYRAALAAVRERMETSCRNRIS
jgi:RNA polymerase sigma-70 factor (ECF subfamily)